MQTNTTEAKAPCPLAVMDDACETLDRDSDGSAGLREARAKVAELVAVVRKVKGVKKPDGILISFEDFADLAVALAAFSDTKDEAQPKPASVTPKFKAGDRVRVSDDYKSGFVRGGDTGNVARLDDDGDPWVLWDNPLIPNSESGPGWCVSADSLTLAAFSEVRS